MAFTNYIQWFPLLRYDKQEPHSPVAGFINGIFTNAIFKNVFMYQQQSYPFLCLRCSGAISSEHNFQKCILSLKMYFLSRLIGLCNRPFVNVYVMYSVVNFLHKCVYVKVSFSLWPDLVPATMPGYLNSVLYVLYW